MTQLLTWFITSVNDFKMILCSYSLVLSLPQYSMVFILWIMIPFRVKLGYLVIGSKNTWIPWTGYFLFPAPLARTGIKRFNLAASPTISKCYLWKPVISGSLNTQRICPWSHRCLFPHVSEWENVFLGQIRSRDGHGSCNTTVWSPVFLGACFCHFWLQKTKMAMAKKQTGWYHDSYVHNLYSLLRWPPSGTV